MPLLVYRPRNFDQTHEREEFRNLCGLLKERYGTSPDEMCIFIGNYNIGDVELDGIIIKDEGVAIVEFKDYGGKITAVEKVQGSDNTVSKPATDIIIDSVKIYTAE